MAYPPTTYFKYLKKAKLWLLLFWSGLTIWTQIWWIGVFAFVCLLSLLIDHKLWYLKFSKTFVYKSYAVVKWTILILLLSVVVRAFFLEVFRIPSSSMEKTLIPGDIILVEKVTLGADRPKSFLDLANLGILLSLNETIKQFLEWHTLPKKRLNGFRDVNHNDILVFKSPSNDMILVKRMVACAGDTIQICKGTLMINGKPAKENSLVTHEWLIVAKEHVSLRSVLDSLNIEAVNYRRYSNDFHYKLTLSNEDAYKISTCSAIASIQKTAQPLETGNRSLCPYNGSVKCSIDNWGPVVVPAKGLPIKLTPQNIEWYSKAITKHEHHKLASRNDSVFIDGLYKTSYVFEQDYMFAMGDNRNQSFDSRFLGFVPFDNVVGVARLVLLPISPDQKGMDTWNISRTFKFLK